MRCYLDVLSVGSLSTSHRPAILRHRRSSDWLRGISRPRAVHQSPRYNFEYFPNYNICDSQLLSRSSSNFQLPLPARRLPLPRALNVLVLSARVNRAPKLPPVLPDRLIHRHGSLRASGTPHNVPCWTMSVSCAVCHFSSLHCEGSPAFRCIEEPL
jgi:hypothetical protein